MSKYENVAKLKVFGEKNIEDVQQNESEITKNPSSSTHSNEKSYDKGTMLAIIALILLVIIGASLNNTGSNMGNYSEYAATVTDSVSVDEYLEEVDVCDDVTDTIGIDDVYEINDEPYEQNFIQIVNEAEARIEELKMVERLIASSIENVEKVLANANMTHNPQQFIDCTVLRYERNMRKIQLAIAKTATQAANNLHKFRGKNDVNQTVLTEGIAKYKEIASFANEYSKDLYEKFSYHLSQYVDNYGYDCEGVFREDDSQLRTEYGIY